MSQRIDSLSTSVASSQAPSEIPLEELAFQFGRTYDSYLATEEGLPVSGSPLRGDAKRQCAGSSRTAVWF